MTTPTPEAIEAAARAINEQHEFPAPLWIALVESKDRADQNRVKRDRAYAAAALTAAYPLLEASAKAEALREAADACAPDYETTDTRSVAKWLRARAATIAPDVTP